MRARSSAILALFATAGPGCGALLHTADVSPSPRHEGPIEVSVSGVGATDELIRGADEGPEADSVLAVELALRNRTGGPLTLPLSELRLRLGSAGTPGQAVAPVTAGEGELPMMVGRSGTAPTILLAPGQSRRIWAAFAGFRPQRLPATAETALLLPGAPAVALEVASPKQPAPRLTARRNPSVTNLRLGLAAHEAFMNFESLNARRGWVFGVASSLGISEAHDAIPSKFGIGLGPRIGWLYDRFRVGVVAGADGIAKLWAEEGAPEGEGRTDWAVAVFGALRISSGSRVGIGRGVVPIEDPTPSPFRSYTIDLGYRYVRAIGEGESGGSLMATLGAPLFF